MGKRSHTTQSEMLWISPVGIRLSSLLLCVPGVYLCSQSITHLIIIIMMSCVFCSQVLCDIHSGVLCKNDHLMNIKTIIQLTDIIIITILYLRHTADHTMSILFLLHSI